jgi:hypothetical protein
MHFSYDKTMRGREIPGQHPELSPDKFASRGADMVIAVSDEYPAAVTCQAAKIALICRDEGLIAYNLGIALLEDNEQIERISRANADAAEKRSEVTPQQVRNRVRWNFIGAEILGKLPSNNLNQILSLYPREGSTDGISDSPIRLQAEAMLPKKYLRIWNQALPAL